jgi:hypothetical protein
MKRLDEILASEFPNLRVEHRQYLSFASTGGLAVLDRALSVGKTQREALVAMIDDSPVSDFVIDRIGRTLDATEDYELELGPTRLTDFAAFADPAAAARGIVAEFDALPWDYTVSFPLPVALAEQVSAALGDAVPLELSENVSPVRPGAALDALPMPDPPAPRTGLGLLFAGLSQPEWDERGLYLQIRTRGFIDRYGITGTAQDATALLQAFIGLGIAQQVFRYDWKVPQLGPRSAYHVHICDGDIWRYDATVNLDSGIAAALSAMACEDYGSPDTLARILMWALVKMQTCFRHPKEAARIMRAGRWLFDSYGSRNETLAFVQSMVALEILLGEKALTDVVGIGTLLSNRCAYLIGKSQAQREELLADFGGLYKVRSDIVHSGKSRLSNSERAMLNKLRWICARAIQEEINLLEQDVRKSS